MATKSAETFLPAARRRAGHCCRGCLTLNSLRTPKQQCFGITGCGTTFARDGEATFSNRRLSDIDQGESYDGTRPESLLAPPHACRSRRSAPVGSPPLPVERQQQQ